MHRDGLRPPAGRLQVDDWDRFVVVVTALQVATLAMCAVVAIWFDPTAWALVGAIAGILAMWKVFTRR